jgi:hypothetical protein
VVPRDPPTNIVASAKEPVSPSDAEGDSTDVIEPPNFSEGSERDIKTKFSLENFNRLPSFNEQINTTFLPANSTSYPSSKIPGSKSENGINTPPDLSVESEPFFKYTTAVENSKTPSVNILNNNTIGPEEPNGMNFPSGKEIWDSEVKSEEEGEEDWVSEFQIEISGVQKDTLLADDDEYDLPIQYLDEPDQIHFQNEDNAKSEITSNENGSIFDDLPDDYIMFPHQIFLMQSDIEWNSEEKKGGTGSNQDGPQALTPQYFYGNSNSENS